MNRNVKWLEKKVYLGEIFSHFDDKKDSEKIYLECMDITQGTYKITILDEQGKEKLTQYENSLWTFESRNCFKYKPNTTKELLECISNTRHNVSSYSGVDKIEYPQNQYLHNLK